MKTTIGIIIILVISFLFLYVCLKTIFLAERELDNKITEKETLTFLYLKKFWNGMTAISLTIIVLAIINICKILWWESEDIFLFNEKIGFWYSVLIGFCAYGVGILLPYKCLNPDED